MPKPNSSPATPPMMPIISPSARNIRQMLERVVPMAIIVPISRVRSKIDITIVLATLKITMPKTTIPMKPKMPL